MCYSAQIEADYRKYVKRYGADIDIGQFVRLYWDRSQGAKVKIPKALDAAFAQPDIPDGQRIRTMIEHHDAEQATKLQTELFKQRKRLADAERALLTRTTKKAQEDQRIATGKIAWTLGKLSDLKRTERVDEDSRIFPGWYAPVMVMEGSRRVVKPMRYQCRPAGKPASNDVKFPGTYNARRDNLEGFWKGQFGFSHGVMVASAFYENVARHTMEHRDWHRARRRRTSSSNSGRSRTRKCSSRACGRIGPGPARICCPSPRSRTSLHRKSPRPAMIAASFRSRQGTSTPGYVPIRTTLLRSTPSSMTANGRTTNTAWPPDCAKQGIASEADPARWRASRLPPLPHRGR